MSEQERILAIYAEISARTGEMVDAARSSDWDRLAALEQDCRALVETLRHGDAGTAAGARFLQRKIAFIHKVLADDAEVRKFTEPWMTELEAYLGNTRRERRLRRAYETGHG